MKRKIQKFHFGQFAECMSQKVMVFTVHNDNARENVFLFWRLNISMLIYSILALN